jgi:PTS system N-acetylglucosamine-specific IIC component
MYRSVRPDRRLLVGGLLFSMALTSFLTGVTEPIEFTFMFLAPALYAVHAVLTGTSMVLMEMLGVRLGFGFSAGLFDYLLNFNIATRPLWLLPVGAAYFAVYYAMFRFFIVRFNLPTPGREPTAVASATSTTGSDGKIAAMVSALGGPGNLVSVDACTTRLRLVVADERLVQADELKELGVHGVIRSAANAVQVVVGPTADQVAGRIRAYMDIGERRVASDSGTTPPVRSHKVTELAVQLPQSWTEAFGGAANVRKVERLAGRLRVEISDREKVDGGCLASLDLRAIVWISPNVAHVLCDEKFRVPSA